MRLVYFCCCSAIILSALCMGGCKRSSQSSSEQTAASSATPTPGLPSKVGDTWTNSLGMKFVYIPAGEFLMGSSIMEDGRGDGEFQHRVRLTKPFLLGVHPVTRGQFAAFVKLSGYKTQAEKEGSAYTWTPNGWGKLNGACWRVPGFTQDDNHPVVCISWNDAQALVQWLRKNEKTHNGYRLPTEAEWEYACRAGTKTPYYTGTGEEALKEAGWYRANSQMRTHPVMQKKPNAWGLYDMHGNAWQWCADWCGACDTVAVTDPTGPSSGSERISRGGSWVNGDEESRAAYHVGSPPDEHCAANGVRLALDLR